jgi:hypothetical protein
MKTNAAGECSPHIYLRLRPSQVVQPMHPCSERSLIVTENGDLGKPEQPMYKKPISTDGLFIHGLFNTLLTDKSHRK